MYNKAKNYRIISVPLLIIILVIVVFDFNSTTMTTLNSSSLLVTCCLSFVVLLLYLFSHERVKELRGQVFKVSTIFLTSFYIVHFFNYIYYSFDIVDLQFLASNYVNRAAKLSLCCFIALIIGVIITNKPFVDLKRLKVDYKLIDILCYIELFSIILFYAYTDKRYFSAGGNSAVLNEIGWHPLGAVGNVSCIACVIGSVVSVYYRFLNEKKISKIEYIKSFPFKFYVFTLVYLSLVLISGDRGPIVDVLFAYVAGFIIVTKKKIKIPYIFITLIVAANVLSFMSYLRGNPDDLSIAKIVTVSDRVIETREDGNVMFETTKDLSNVVDAYHLVFQQTESFGVIWGLGIAFQVFAILPGFRSLCYNLFGFDISLLSTDALATLLLGEDYGAGTTCIADSYYNLGLYGSIFLFYLFGIFVKKCDLCLYKYHSNIFITIMAFCFLTKAVYLGRSTLFQPINIIVYTYVYFKLANYLVLKFK